MTLVGGQLGSPEVKVRILAIVSVVSSQSSHGPGLYLHFSLPENIHSISMNWCLSVSYYQVLYFSHPFLYHFFLLLPVSYSLNVFNFDLSVL